MEKVEIRKGDIVGRISYNKDILFYVDRIIKEKNGKSYAILKGIQYRIEANAPMEDLEKIEKTQIEVEKRGINEHFKKRIEIAAKQIFPKEKPKSNALILHLDGDRRYTKKSAEYYSKLGLKAIVRNVPEYKQPNIIRRSCKEVLPRYCCNNADMMQ